MNTIILLLFLVSSISCGKLVPIVRMVNSQGVSTYSLNNEEPIRMEKQGYKKFEEAGSLLSVDEYEKVKEKCPHLRPIIRYATKFGGKTLYRLATTYHLKSKSVIGFAVSSARCGAIHPVREFSAKTHPDHIYILGSLKTRFPSYSQYVMSGTPFYVWTNEYNGDFTDN